MTSTGARGSVVRDHPFLAVYLVALALVWLATVLTWDIRSDQPPRLHPAAQALQYLLVVTAATLAALRLRVDQRQMRDDARFAFYDLRWSISDDVGGQTFWTALWVGAAAMLLNVVLLAGADLLVAGGTSGLPTYLEWMGAGIAAGAVVGMFSALLAAVVATLLRLRRS